MEKKYELTDETMEYKGHTLHRIIYVKNTGAIRKGMLGGFVESEDNLSHEGNCWIGENAMVFGKAKVIESAYVGDRAIIYGDDKAPLISGHVVIFSDTEIYGDVKISGTCSIFGKSIIKTLQGGNINISEYVTMKNANLTTAKSITITDSVGIADSFLIDDIVIVNDIVIKNSMVVGPIEISKSVVINNCNVSGASGRFIISGDDLIVLENEAIDVYNWADKCDNA